MDALSDVLNSVRLEGAVYLNAEFTAPWCIRGELGLASVRQRLVASEHVAFFHFLTEGRCKVRLADGGEVLEASAGDLILFPKEGKHLMGTDLQLAPMEAQAALTPDPESGAELFHMRHGALRLRLPRAEPQRVPAAVRGAAAARLHSDGRGARGGDATRALPRRRAGVHRTAAWRGVDARQARGASLRGGAAPPHRTPAARRQGLARRSARRAGRTRARPPARGAWEALDR